MALLISPNLIPFIHYYNEEDDQIKDWDETFSPADPVCFWSDQSGTLRVEGEELSKQLRQIATIYRTDERIRAVPRKLLEVNAVAEVGCLREARWDEYRRQGGLLLQVNEHILSSSGLTDLTQGWLREYAVALFEPHGTIVGFDESYEYDDMVKREFDPYYC